MDVKGKQDDITYPLLFFSIDNFDEVFEQVTVKPDQSVCVELIANIDSVRFEPNASRIGGNVRKRAHVIEARAVEDDIAKGVRATMLKK